MRDLFVTDHHHLFPLQYFIYLCNIMKIKAVKHYAEVNGNVIEDRKAKYQQLQLPFLVST